MKKSYCTQNNNDCSTCSLVNYGLDCANNPITDNKSSRKGTKEDRILANFDGHKGIETMSHFKKLVGKELVDCLTGREYGLVMSAVNRAYQAGKASTGAELIDGGIVWINSINKGYDVKDIQRIQKKENEIKLTNIPLNQSDRNSGAHGKWIDGKYYNLINIRNSDGTPRNQYNSLVTYNDGELIADGYYMEEVVEFI